MYQILNKRNTFDRTPFQFARMDYLRGRVLENLASLKTLRGEFSGRLESSHILFKILTNVSSSFDGNLFSFMERCERDVKRLAGGLGLVTSYSKGRVFTDYQFYDDCTEIITAVRDPRYGVMDLWDNWRGLSPITVMVHPITDLTVVELGVMNAFDIESGGLAMINIDIPLLAAQWMMWRATYPDSTMEHFLTSIPLVNAVESHLDVALFNLVAAQLGIVPYSKVRTNLPFAQTPVNKHAADLASEINGKLKIQRLTAGQVLDTVPTFNGGTYLNNTFFPDTTPTNQVVWALIARKIDCVAVVLEQGKLTGYDKLLKEITIIRRTLIQAQEDKQLSNGLESSFSDYLIRLLDERVVSRLP